MDRTARLLAVAAYVAMVGATAVLWRRSYRVSYVFYWRRRRRGFYFYVSYGQFRLFWSWLAPTSTDSATGFGREFHRFAPWFSPTRMPGDTIHLALAGFTYVRGRNSNTGARYRAVSIPIWLPAVIALVVLVGCNARWLSGG